MLGCSASAVPTVVVEGPLHLHTGADVESGYLSNEYSQTILYILRLFSDYSLYSHTILRLFSDYSQTILRPDKARVDQPTNLVGWWVSHFLSHLTHFCPTYRNAVKTSIYAGLKHCPI